MLLPACLPGFTDSELLVLRTATCRAAWLPPRRIEGATRSKVTSEFQGKRSRSEIEELA
jgi:hypothetical protein